MKEMMVFYGGSAMWKRIGLLRVYVGECAGSCSVGRDGCQVNKVNGAG